jgi:hypothetical protein
MSVRGVGRRYRSVNGGFSVREVFEGPSLRGALESLARTEHSFDRSECIYGWTAAFEQTWSHVRVRIRLDPDDGIAAATINTLSTTWANGIAATWSNRWGVGRAGEASCPLTFEVRWVAEDEHHTVRVRPGPAQTNKSTWDTSDGGATAAHEFGHMLGHADEYTDANCPNRSPVNTGTVMDNNSNNVPARMMRRFANELGSYVVPGLNFSPTPIQFGSVPVGVITTRTLTIDNSTGADVTVTLPEPPPGPFRWPAFNGAIPNDEVEEVAVEFDPLVEGLAQATLTITSSAAGSPFSIGLRGRAVGGAAP